MPPYSSSSSSSHLSPNSRPNYWPDSVSRKLSKLKRGDHVSITWLDASQSSNVVPAKQIANKSVETRVVSEGVFYSTQRGEAYSDLHVLIVKDTADSYRLTLQSIPLCLVKDIVVFEKSELETKHTTRVRSVIRFSDGVIKQIGH